MTFRPVFVTKTNEKIGSQRVFATRDEAQASGDIRLADWPAMKSVEVEQLKDWPANHRHENYEDVSFFPDSVAKKYEKKKAKEVSEAPAAEAVDESKRQKFAEKAKTEAQKSRKIVRRKKKSAEPAVTESA